MQKLIHERFDKKRNRPFKDISEFDESFIKIYNGESDEEYPFEFDIQYLENLNSLHNDLPFLPERRKIEKVRKLVANLHDKTEYVN